MTMMMNSVEPAGGAGSGADEVGPAVEGPRAGRATRRTFSAEYKREIVAEYDAAPTGSKGAVLRRERLYDSHVKEWRAAIQAGTLPTQGQGRARRGKKTPEQVRIAELEKQVRNLESDTARKDQIIADREAALEVLGKGVGFFPSALQEGPTVTRSAWRDWQAQTVNLLAVLIGIAWACALVGRSRATHYRWANPAPAVLGPRPKPVHPGELTGAEREAVVGVLTSQEYANMAVAQVWARELDEGRYYCSQRTMYRILTEHGLGGERRRQATHPPRAIPELIATAVNDVWSWDITKMRGPAKGIWYHAYVVLDIFSRYIVAWRIEGIEDGQLATDMISGAITEQGVAPGYVHADGGAAMTSKPLASLLVDLDVRRSHNRPRTSNDNPFSESQFKTMKYTPDYPQRFASIGEARAWMGPFVDFYNHEHRHSGIGLHTPASVHYGSATDIQARRQHVLDEAYAAHPQRFSRRPHPPQLPQKVTINDPEKRTTTSH